MTADRRCFKGARLILGVAALTAAHGALQAQVPGAMGTAVRLVGTTPAVSIAHRAPASETAEEAARALHLLHRATWGVRPADLSALLDAGLEAWLDRQLHPERIDERDADARLDGLAILRMSMAELAAEFQPTAEQQRQRQAMMDGASAGAMGPDTPGTAAGATPELRRALQQRNPQQILNELVTARLVRAVHAERQLEDVLTDFWFNHLNVFFGKNQVRFMAADYERRAIRPNVFGKFEDMLVASAKHPAMLLYLDNGASVAPDSMREVPAAQLRVVERLRQLTPAERERMVRTGRLTQAQLEQFERLQQGGALPAAAPQRARGMNENYARELLELHTLGVDGGYTQQDVVEVARALTGWTFAPLPRPGAPARPAPARSEPGTFHFDRAAHDSREKVVLGHALPAGRGIEDGEDVIRMLARHPSTARHLATKLVERFVSDTPDADFVDELADVYLRTDGDLREVTRALFTSERFYASEVRGAKIKIPFELVASALRVVNAEVAGSRRIAETLRSMGHLPYNEPAPTGFPASNADWVNSGALIARMNFALELAAGRIDGVRPEPMRLAPAANPRQTEALVAAVLAAALPSVQSGALAEAIVADLERNAVAQPRAVYARAVGLALGSPEFQRR